MRAFRSRWPYVGLALLAIWGCGPSSERLAAVEKKTDELAVKLESVSKAVDLDLQGKCAKQARETFQIQQWHKQPMAGWTNHYNKSLNKCFIEIENWDAGMRRNRVWISKLVVDAFENNTYGEYDWSNQPGKAGSGGRVVNC